MTDSGILDSPTWVPQSQVTEDSEVYAKGHKGALHVTAWYAKQKGWE
jgi:hypothetical protein